VVPPCCKHTNAQLLVRCVSSPPTSTLVLAFPSIAASVYLLLFCSVVLSESSHRLNFFRLKPSSSLSHIRPCRVSLWRPHFRQTHTRHHNIVLLNNSVSTSTTPAYTDFSGADDTVAWMLHVPGNRRIHVNFLSTSVSISSMLIYHMQRSKLQSCAERFHQARHLILPAKLGTIFHQRIPAKLARCTALSTVVL
jgi:hypothetical protein